VTGASAASLEAVARAKRAVRTIKANPTPATPGPGTSPGRRQAPVYGRPRLTDERPFILLDPTRLEVPPRRAASIAGPARVWRRLGVVELQPVDLVVYGSVAVNREAPGSARAAASRTWSVRCWSRPV
jgi:5-formyltetrahydrofolate cyclo-ligase